MSMKYFTPEWWSNSTGSSSYALDDYEAYFESVREKLPAALIELHDAHTLHDSRIVRVGFDTREGTLTIDVEGWDRAFAHPARYVLCFAGVRAFEQSVPKFERRLPEWGDLGYYECEWLGDRIEMRMLFESNAIFRVEFVDFSFETTSICS